MRIFFTLLLVIVLLPENSNAGFFDFFRGNTPSATSSEKTNNAFSSNKSDCGKQIEIFKRFMHDGKICKKDDDCVTMDGICPLGCKFYLNENFVEIIETEMGKVADLCDNPVCAAKCPKANIKPVCRQNKCQARTY